MPIHLLQLTNVGPFRSRPDGSGADGIKLELDPNVNLFIGPNNVGKSTILEMIHSLTGQDLKVALEDKTRYSISHQPTLLAIEWRDMQGQRRYFRFPKLFSPTWGRGWLCAGGEGDVLFAVVDGKEKSGREVMNRWDDLIKEHGYVGYYNPLRHDRKSQYRSITVDGEDMRFTEFDSDIRIHDDFVAEIIYADGEAYYGRRGIVTDNDINLAELAALRHSRSIVGQEVFDEIAYIINTIVDGFVANLAKGVYRVDDEEFGYVSQTVDGEVKMDDLSHGTISVIEWLSYFMIGMARHYRGASDWKERAGIFIIDEIDAHLHPSWQRRIIPTLQRHFPNVQIFASTHSPMTVAGLKKGQVHLLKRDETGQVVWSRNEQDIIGWTADEIYRTFMGIDDPTDELTVQRANRLRELRGKESLAPEEEREMDELRRQVNQDLLAKGPVSAQDERYAELMHRFLRSLETELSQDGA